MTSEAVRALKLHEGNIVLIRCDGGERVGFFDRYADNHIRLTTTRNDRPVGYLQIPYEIITSISILAPKIGTPEPSNDIKPSS